MSHYIRLVHLFLNAILFFPPNQKTLVRDSEMTQVFSTLPEDLSMVPRTHIRGLTTSCSTGSLLSLGVWTPTPLLHERLVLRRLQSLQTMLSFKLALPFSLRTGYAVMERRVVRRGSHEQTIGRLRQIRDCTQIQLSP